MKRLILLLIAALLTVAMVSCGENTAPGETTEPFSVPESHPQLQDPTVTEPPAELPTEPALTIPIPEPADDALVPVSDYIPGIMVELRYASVDNFTGQRIYDFDTPFLRYGTVKKLLAVQEQLEDRGLGLKIWDGFRPVSAQYALWEVCPDPRYVADPRTGFSSHSRGNTVDITLVDATGSDLIMPTGFDDFSALADRDYSDCDPEAAKNALLLQQVMEAAGFTGYFGEWWHFTDTVSYEVEKTFTPVAVERYYALCDAFITLRALPDTAGEELLKIPAGASFPVLAVCGDFYYVNYQGIPGYVLASYTAPVTE